MVDENEKTEPVIARFTDMKIAGLMLGAAVLIGAVYFLMSPDPVVENPQGHKMSTMIKNAKNPGDSKNTAAAKPAPSASGYQIPKDYRVARLARTGNNLDFDSRDPEFDLKWLRNYYSMQGGYEKAKEVWGGPADLSLRIWVGHDDESLQVRIDVRDDKHFQRVAADKPNDLFMNDSIQLSFTTNKWQQQWEFGFALNEDGKVLRYCWMAPTLPESKGLIKEQVVIDREAATKSVGCRVIRTAEGERYFLRFPLKEMHLTRALLNDGLRFNVIYNDTDSETLIRKGWIEIAPGIGQTKDNKAFAEIRFLD